MGGGSHRGGGVAGGDTMIGDKKRIAALVAQLNVQNERVNWLASAWSDQQITIRELNTRITITASAVNEFRAADYEERLRAADARNPVVPSKTMWSSEVVRGGTVTIAAPVDCTVKSVTITASSLREPATITFFKAPTAVSPFNPAPTQWGTRVRYNPKQFAQGKYNTYQGLEWLGTIIPRPYNGRQFGVKGPELVWVIRDLDHQIRGCYATNLWIVTEKR